jgi:hypothetical protein
MLCATGSCAVLPNTCRPERRRLYQHWLNTLANRWGSDIDDLITELQEEQKKLQALYDRQALQVRGAHIGSGQVSEHVIRPTQSLSQRFRKNRKSRSACTCLQLSPTHLTAAGGMSGYHCQSLAEVLAWAEYCAVPAAGLAVDSVCVCVCVCVCVWCFCAACRCCGVHASWL